jgi:hypothetical protein
MISTTGSASSPRTPHENSRPATNSSASTSGVRPAASMMVFDHASCERTMTTPALEPLARGLTTSGRFNEPGKSGSVPPVRSNTSHAGVGKPSAASSFFVRCLSIATAHAAMPLPV